MDCGVEIFGLAESARLKIAEIVLAEMRDLIGTEGMLPRENLSRIHTMMHQFSLLFPKDSSSSNPRQESDQ